MFRSIVRLRLLLLLSTLVLYPNVNCAENGGDNNQDSELWYNSDKFKKLHRTKVKYVDLEEAKEKIYIYRRGDYTQVDIVSEHIFGWTWVVFNQKSTLIKKSDVDISLDHKYMIHSMKNDIPLDTVLVFDNISLNKHALIWTQYFPPLEDDVKFVDYFEPTCYDIVQKAGIDMENYDREGVRFENVEVRKRYLPPYRVLSTADLEGKVIRLDPDFKIRGRNDLF